MALRNCQECGKEVSDAALSCPHCGFPFKLASSSEGRVLRRSSFLGEGCAIQLLAVGCLLAGLFLILTVVAPLILWPLGIFLMILGRRRSHWSECSCCGSRLPRYFAKVCPSCGAKLG